MPNERGSCLSSLSLGDSRCALELDVHSVADDGKDLSRVKDVQAGVDLVAEELFRPLDPVSNLTRLAVDDDAAKLLGFLARDLDGHDGADAAVRGMELLQFGEGPVANNVRVENKDLVRVALEDDVAVVVQASVIAAASVSLVSRGGGGRVPERESVSLTRRFRALGTRAGSGC